MQDVNGRAYARLSNLNPGDKVQCDGGFTCLAADSLHTVCYDDHGLYIACSGPNGNRPGEHHYLDGQVEMNEYGNDYCVGIYPVA